MSRVLSLQIPPPASLLPLALPPTSSFAVMVEGGKTHRKPGVVPPRDFGPESGSEQGSAEGPGVRQAGLGPV